MNILITGTSSGIGLAIAEFFIEREGAGVAVWGIDLLPAPSALLGCKTYTHIKADVSDPNTFPDLPKMNIVVNNAGLQSMSFKDIEVNLCGVINITEKYALHSGIRSICNIASVSGHNGAEFPHYAASKGGVLAYTKWTALEVAKYGATCNSISPGGVITALNAPVMNDSEKWQAIMAETPLKKWATPQEIAQWVYFLTIVNKSMTAQDVIVDNGEIARANFVW